MIVLDASALLAFMFREAGHESVGAAFAAGCMSTVNLSEVLARFARDGHPVDAVLSSIEKTALEFVDFSRAHAAIAGGLADAGQSVGLSLGDRACIALAIERKLPVLTADRAWLRIALPIRVQTVR